MTLEDIAYIAALAWLAIAGLLAERENRKLRTQLSRARAELRARERTADHEGTLVCSDSITTGEVL